MLKKLLGKRPGGVSAKIPQRALVSPAPASFAQQRLWFLDQLAPGNPFYNISDAIRFRQAVDAELLERSLNEIVRRHEILRTHFVAVHGEPMQVIAERLSIPVRILDLRHLPAAERETQARREAAGRRAICSISPRGRCCAPPWSGWKMPIACC